MSRRDANYRFYGIDDNFAAGRAHVQIFGLLLALLVDRGDLKPELTIGVAVIGKAVLVRPDFFDEFPGSALVGGAEPEQFLEFGPAVGSISTGIFRLRIIQKIRCLCHLSGEHHQAGHRQGSHGHDRLLPGN